MEIPKIKQSLEITQIAEHLGIQIDARTQRANCPFHPDKTPSLQFSKQKQIATCFSSNCDAGTMDVIGLTEKKLNKTTHEVLKYLESIILKIDSPMIMKVKKPNSDYEKDFEIMQTSFKNSKTAKSYAESRNLDWQQLEIGYNALNKGKFDYLKGCIVFPLKDKQNKVVSLYGRSLDKGHYYTTDRQGLYPGHPSADTKKLILTESIIDAATLIQQNEITAAHTVLALYGTNGLTKEHIEAIGNLEELDEIVFWFDGDAAGRKAALKYHKQLLDLIKTK